MRSSDGGVTRAAPSPVPSYQRGYETGEIRPGRRPGTEGSGAIHFPKYKRALLAVAELIHGRANIRWAVAENAVRTVTDNTAFASVLLTEQGWPIESRPTSCDPVSVRASSSTSSMRSEAILAKQDEEAALNVCSMADMICVPGFGWGGVMGEGEDERDACMIVQYRGRRSLFLESSERLTP